MKKPCLLVGAVCACLAVVSINAMASIISADWQTLGDNLITQDTGSGLEWLDTTETVGRSYNDISGKLGAGQEFDGWRYATPIEIGEFFDAFGGVRPYDGWSTANEGLYDQVASFWGDGGGLRQISVFTAETTDTLTLTALIGDFGTQHPGEDAVSLNNGFHSKSFTHSVFASAIVRDSAVVPIPAAAWLFGSALGLLGWIRRKSVYPLSMN